MCQGEAEKLSNSSEHCQVRKVASQVAQALSRISEHSLRGNFAGSPNSAYPGPEQPGRAGGVVIFRLVLSAGSLIRPWWQT
jgi:hypothetical protein